jgi:hypothetical protein
MLWNFKNSIMSTNFKETFSICMILLQCEKLTSEWFMFSHSKYDLTTQPYAYSCEYNGVMSLRKCNTTMKTCERIDVEHTRDTL